MRKAAKDVEEYLQDFPPEVRARLDTVRSTIQSATPESTEGISYAIPTYKLHGKNLVHFAGYAKHIGFYPGSKALEIFAAELTGYKTSKGTVQFPHDRPLPLELLTRMVEWCNQRS